MLCYQEVRGSIPRGGMHFLFVSPFTILIFGRTSSRSGRRLGSPRNSTTQNGKGQRTQHFTGWASLVMKMMSMPDLVASEKSGHDEL
ncbi:hypothetical protein BJX99DRAFT_219370 [Aspergillus californicus]